VEDRAAPLAHARLPWKESSTQYLRNPTHACLSRMKRILAFLFLLLGASGLFGGVHVTVISVQRSKAELRKLPVVVEAAKEKEGSLAVKFVLAEFLDSNLTFDAYELRVISQSVTEITPEKYFHDLRLIERKQRTRESTAAFAVTKDEIARAYFVVSFWKKSEPGQLAQLLSYCIPAAFLSE
jgi:hypothetical protein